MGPLPCSEPSHPVPVAVVLSVRTEDLAANSRIQALLLDMRERNGLREIELGGLSEDETLELAELVADRPLDLAERSTLFEGTDGLPLLDRSRSPRGGLPTDVTDSRRTGPLPEALRSPGPGPPASGPDACGHSWSPRSAERQMLGGSLSSRPPSAETSRSTRWQRRVEQLDEPAVVGALDELWQRRLVRERGLGTYGVSHNRIRDVAYGETSPARRRMLRVRRIAQALELLNAPDLDTVAGQIAAHLEAAGQTRRAAELYEHAAEVAGRVSAFAEVLRSLDRALALLVLEAPSRARDERELGLLFRRAPALVAFEGYSSPRQEAAFVRARELAESLRWLPVTCPPRSTAQSESLSSPVRSVRLLRSGNSA